MTQQTYQRVPTYGQNIFGDQVPGNPWDEFRQPANEESDSSTGQRLHVLINQNRRNVIPDNLTSPNNRPLGQTGLLRPVTGTNPAPPGPDIRPAQPQRPDQNLVNDSLTDLLNQMANMKIDLDNNPVRPERLKMLPQQEQQVQNLKNNLNEANSELEARTLNLAMMEAINAHLNMGLDSQLQKSKTLHLLQFQKLEAERLKLAKADLLASKYVTTLEMPDFKPVPPFYKREVGLLDKKNIVRMVTAYDDTNTNTTRSFKLVWSEILNFGRGEYFKEDEYKHILSVILHGNIAEDFRQMDKEKRSLQHIINELCVLYDTTQTLDDYQREVDNFKRDKNENLKKAMARVNKLIRRLEPLSSADAWSETYDNMRKSVLRQIVGTSTKAHIDMEENRLVKAGATYDVDSLIRMAHEYEQYNNAVPTKDVQTVYQVASMAPRRNATDISSLEDQLSHLKAEKSQTKNWESKLDEVIQLATNAAHVKERSRSFDRKDARSGFKPPRPRSMETVAKAVNSGEATATSLTAQGSPKSNYRADTNPPRSDSSKERSSGRSNSYRDQSENRPRYPDRNRDRDRSDSRNRQPSSRDRSSSNNRSRYDDRDRPRRPDRSYSRYDDRDRSRSNQRSRTPERESSRSSYRSNSNDRTASRTDTKWSGPKLIVQGNKHCYECAPCNTMHPGDMVCPKYYESKN